MQLQKDTLDRAETVYGKRGATRLFHLGVVLFVAIAIAGILTSASVVYRQVVRPLLDVMPTIQLQGLSAYNNALIAIGVTVLLFVIAGLLSFRYIRRWQKVVIVAIDGFIKQNLEELATTEWVQEQVDALGKRIAPFEDDKRMKELTALLVERAMKHRLTIHSAKYGAVDKWNNVTEIVRALVRDNSRIDSRVENDVLGGDPRPGSGHPRELHVVFSSG